MKTKFVLLAMVWWSTAALQAQTLGTAFSYQGQLIIGGNAVNGAYDLSFSLYNVPSGSQMGQPPVETNLDVGVSNGLFTTMVNFGSNVFTGEAYWLEIGVRTNGSNGGFTTLSPRQQLTPAPYAIYSPSAGVAGVANAVSASSIVQGAGLSIGVNEGMLPEYSTITGGSNNFAQFTFDVIGGGFNNVAGAPYVTVGGGSGNTASGLNSFIGGGEGNTALGRDTVIGGGGFNSASSYDVVAGGQSNVITADWSSGGGGLGNQIHGRYSWIDAGYYNQISGNYCGIGGGETNAINTNSDYSFIGGGQGNIIESFSQEAMIGGGVGNTTYAPESAIAGGGDNYIGSGGMGAFVGGGVGNQAEAYYATVSGGQDNHAFATNATVGGGNFNLAEGLQSTIAGGFLNIATGVGATIGGGCTNEAYGIGSFVGGGGFDGSTYNRNQVQANAGTICGGIGNTIPTGANYAFIGGGLQNAASGVGGVVGGGYSNTNFGYCATIPGGFSDSAMGSYSVAAGGYGNEAYGDYSFAAGYVAQAEYAGDFVWADAESPSFASTSTNQFLIRADGGVGIDTPAPQQALSINGGLNIDQGDNNAGYLNQNGANGWGLTFGNNSGEGIGSKRSSGTEQYSLDFYTEFAQRMTILQNGDVGIGTATPDDNLSVNGSADKPGGGSWGTFSDARLKDVGANFTRGLEALNGIQPVQYRYKAGNPLGFDSGPQYIGVVAQQVQQAVPEAVHRSKNGYLVVNNDPIIWTMVNAIKELQAQNDALKRQVTEDTRLHAQVMDLQGQLAVLQKAVALLANKPANSFAANGSKK